MYIYILYFQTKIYTKYITNNNKLIIRFYDKSLLYFQLILMFSNDIDYVKITFNFKVIIMY